MFTKADSPLGASLLHFARAVDKPTAAATAAAARAGALSARRRARGERRVTLPGEPRGEPPPLACAACWPSSPPPRSLGLDGRFIRVEVDVAPGPARLHDRRPRRHRAPGGARAGPRARSATPGSSSRRAGSRSTSRRPTCARPARRSTSRSRSGSCSARSRCGPGPVPVALIGELSLGGEVRAGARACCRWSPPSPARACAGSSSRHAAVDEARLVDGVEVVGVGDARRRPPRRSADAAAPERRSRMPRVDHRSGAGSAADARRSPTRRRAGARTWPRSAASSRRDGRSRSRWPAATACS